MFIFGPFAATEPQAPAPAKTSTLLWRARSGAARFGGEASVAHAAPARWSVRDRRPICPRLSAPLLASPLLSRPLVDVAWLVWIGREYEIRSASSPDFGPALGFGPAARLCGRQERLGYLMGGLSWSPNGGLSFSWSSSSPPPIRWRLARCLHKSVSARELLVWAPCQAAAFSSPPRASGPKSGATAPLRAARFWGQRGREILANNSSRRERGGAQPSPAQASPASQPLI